MGTSRRAGDWVHLLADEGTRELIDTHLRRWCRLTESIIEEAQALRDIDPHLSPAEVAADLVAFVDGLRVQAL